MSKKISDSTSPPVKQLFDYLIQSNSFLFSHMRVSTTSISPHVHIYLCMRACIPLIISVWLYWRICDTFIYVFSFLFMKYHYFYFIYFLKAPFHVCMYSVLKYSVLLSRWFKKYKLVSFVLIKVLFCNCSNSLTFFHSSGC